MRSVFADTGYWIALINPRDQDHVRATQAALQLKGVRIVTSDFVLAELLNGLADARSHLRLLAANTVTSLRAAPGAIVECQSDALFGQLYT